MEIINFRQIINNKNIVQTYETIYNLFKNDNFLYFSCGYYPANHDIKNEDNEYKYYISMYLNMLENIKTNNLSILDISCGLGGSTTTYQKYFNFKKIYGIDINSDFIKFCKEKNNSIKYYVMNSENLTFQNNSFDIITNLDSSFVYNNINNFIDNVCRVLKQDGVFIYADMFINDNIKNILNSKFKYVIEKNISRNISEASKMLLDDIINMKLNKEQKDLLLEFAKSNYEAYNNNYIYKKYICFNDSKYIELRENV